MNATTYIVWKQGRATDFEPTQEGPPVADLDTAIELVQKLVDSGEEHVTIQTVTPIYCERCQGDLGSDPDSHTCLEDGPEEDWSRDR